MSVRVKLGIALVVVIAAIGILMAKVITHASTYYVSVSQLEGGSYRPNQAITVSGDITKKTVSYDVTKQILQFSIQDSDGKGQLPVIFHGAKPDNFSDGWPVIVTGHLSTAGTFRASQILIKCPSKYSSQGSETYHANA